MKRFYILALVATMFAACTSDETQDLRPVDAPETLTVGFEGGDDNTRVQLNEAGKTVWTEDDLVSVFYRSDANQKWQFQGKTGERTGLLKRVSTPEATMQLSDVIVAYPYSEEYYINPKTCNIQAYLPATQSYLKDSFGLDGNLMVSASEYNQIYLKNVCGWLKLQLTGEGEMVQSITLKGNNGEQVAGSIYVDTETATATLAAETNGGYEDGVGGTLVFDDAILTEVVLNCGNGVELGAGATTFYIALPPQTFEKGITVEIADTSGYTMTQSTEKSLAIERNTIQPMAAVAYNGIFKPANNEIYYTNGSTTEATAPNKTDVFGANIVSNLYDAEKEHWVITFDSDVTEIGNDAFRDCTSLTSVTIPDSVTSIGQSAFRDCTSLTSVTIPDSVTSIGDYAFKNCTSLKRVDITDLSAWCKISFGDYYATPLYYGAKLYLNGSELTDITIPSDITEIKNFAFKGCKSLTNVTIPDSVTSIGSSAFLGCTSLTNATIGNGVTSIGYSAFDNCTSLTSVTIGNGVTSIGYDAFYYCTSLTNVTIPDSVTSIGEEAFYNCSSLTNATIGNGVTSIGNDAFRGCSSLTSVTIGNGVTSIGNDAFSGCPSLKRVDITDLSAWCKISFGNSYATPLLYGEKLYLNGSELTDITIPSDIIEIKYLAFYGCNSLTSVTIPDGVTSIGQYAFLGCTSLKAFYGKFASEDNRCLIVDGVLNSFVPAGITSYTIPDSVTSIGEYAFGNCSSLTSINIPDSVTKIGNYAFGGCTSLTSITIPDSVTSIGANAFYKCTSLTSVTIGNGVTEIGADAFYNCTSLTSVTIPDSVTMIGVSAFYNCTSLKEVYCKPTTPPLGGWEMFYNNASGRKIYVPASSNDSIIKAYKAKQFWSSYASYIEEYDFSTGQ